MNRPAPLRPLRAALVTATVLSLAVAGHLLGGGALPAPAVLLGLALLVVAPVTWLAGRRLTPLRLLAAVGTAQLGLHEALAVLSGPTACAPANGAHATSSPTLLCLPEHLHAPGPHELTAAGLAMLAGHLLAGAATALVLARAETALWLLLDWLRTLAEGPRRTHPLPALPRRVLPPASIPRPARRGLRRDRVRGPPAAAASRSTCRA